MIEVPLREVNDQSPIDEKWLSQFSPKGDWYGHLIIDQHRCLDKRYRVKRKPVYSRTCYWMFVADNDEESVEVCELTTKGQVICLLAALGIVKFI